MIEIYGKDFCPYCDKAVALCEQKGVEFTYKKLGRDFNREEMMETFHQLGLFHKLFLITKRLVDIQN